MTPEQFADVMCDILIEKETMLRLYSLLFTALEQNCRLEKLVGSKKRLCPLWLSLQNL